MYDVRPLYEGINLDTSLTGHGCQFKTYVYATPTLKSHMGII